MTFKAFLSDARKALVAAGTVEAGAVALGLLDNAEAGYITAVLGALTSALVWVTKNQASIGKDVAAVRKDAADLKTATTKVVDTIKKGA